MNITEKDLEILNYLGLEKPEKKIEQMRGGVRPGAGNKGYGKTEMIKQNFDRFSPVFWQLMEEMANSTSKDDKKFFITEFNKIQTKMLPQEIGGVDGGSIRITWESQESPTAQETGQDNSMTQENDG